MKQDIGYSYEILIGDDGFKRKIELLDLKENEDCIACTSATVFKRQEREEPQEIPALY